MECDARPDCLCRCDPEDNDYCRYNDETAALQKLEEETKQALNDIDRDELDHDNVHVIVRAMLEAGYRKESEARQAMNGRFMDKQKDAIENLKNASEGD